MSTPHWLLNSPIKHSDADTKNREGEEDPCRKWCSGVWQQSCSGCPAPTLFSLSTCPPMPSTPAPMRRGGPWRNRNPVRENLFRTGTSQPNVMAMGPLCPQSSITLWLCLVPGRKALRRTSAGEPAQNRPLEKEIWTLLEAREWKHHPFP